MFVKAIVVFARSIEMMTAKLKISDIRDDPDTIMPMLTRFCAAVKPDWTPADAMQLCAAGEWTLLMSEEEGFALFSVAVNRFTHAKELHIEAVYHPNAEYSVKDYDRFWDAMATRLGCSVIRMESSRKGWEKFGWSGGWIQYTRPVQEVYYV